MKTKRTLFKLSLSRFRLPKPKKPELKKLRPEKAEAKKSHPEKAKTKKLRLTKKGLKKLILAIFLLSAAGLAAVLIINGVVVGSSRAYILSETDAAKLEDVDCIMILGCGVHPDGTPTDMLADRTAVGIRMFGTGVTDRLLMSGDHSRTNYDEVNTMKGIAVDAGIDKDCVFCDHAGFSTYDSMYRARNIFQAKKIIIISQSYHLPRAIYIARHLGIDAYGISATERDYGGQIFRDVRELLARFKDFGTCIFYPEPTFLGDVIPISGLGSLTDG